jgi:hypothetical protein
MTAACVSLSSHSLVKEPRVKPSQKQPQEYHSDIPAKITASNSNPSADQPSQTAAAHNGKPKPDRSREPRKTSQSQPTKPQKPAG